jgi:hypothetical protein
MNERVQRARQLTKEAKDLNLLIGRSWTRIAKIYTEIDTDDLWRDAGFESFGDWLRAVGDHERSQAYEYKRIYREMQEAKIPEAVIAKVPLRNAKDLLKVPESKRTAAVAKDACEQTNRQFRETIERVSPGLALDPHDYKGFKLGASAKQFIDEAIALAKEREEGVESDGQALEVICKAYMLGESERYRQAVKEVVIAAVEAASSVSQGEVARLEFLANILGSIEVAREVFGITYREIEQKLGHPVGAKMNGAPARVQ